MKSEGFIHNNKTNLTKTRVGLNSAALGQTIK